MKKLMMAVAIVCAAVAANAASFDWEVNGAFYWGDDSATGEELAGATIYAFDGNIYNMATVMSAISTGDTTVLGSALGSGTVNDMAEVSFGGTGITDDGASPAYINSFLVAVTADEKFATSFAVDPIEVTDAVIGSGAGINVDWAVATLPGGADWQSVPEPTSGLLLLIGMAGLALRRRRA